MCERERERERERGEERELPACTYIGGSEWGRERGERGEIKNT